MKKRRVILPAICFIPLLSGCATHPSASVESWTVKPLTVAMKTVDKPEALYQLGRYYQGQNRYELAISTYLRAIAVDGGFVEAHNGLGVIYSMQGRYHEAVEAFKLAVKLAPDASHIYSNLGYAYYAQGLNAESIAALEQATALDPANQRALNNLGLAYAKAGNRDGSIQAFAQADNVQTTARAVGMIKAPPQDPAPQSISNVAGDYAAPAATGSASAPRVTLQVQPPAAASRNSGAITQTSSRTAVPVVESRVRAVQVAPNVYELQEQRTEQARVAVVSASPIASGKFGTGEFRIEVSNGNGITGMASKVGRFLHGGGYPAARLTNQKPFQVKVTQIQYRDGYQAEAQDLRSSLPGQPALVLSSKMRADIGVRLVLGKDIARNVAYFDSKEAKIRVAHNQAKAY